MSAKMNINFMGVRKIAALFSVALIIASVASLVVQQLEFGLDFTGGTLVEVGYKEGVELEPIRNALANTGEYEDAVVQHFGQANDVLIRLPVPEDEKEIGKMGGKIVAILEKDSGEKVELRRVETVGPQVGDELRDESGIAMIVALFFMLIYVGLRFKFKFALGALVALFHDVIIVLGAFSLLKIQFDLTVLAAVLAVIGYSLNDTIVVSDRIRENFRKMRAMTPAEIINESLNQTLSRTLITSLTTLLVLIALLVFGGELIRGFAIALSIGVFIGTYSSIYVASNMLLLLNISKEDFIEKEPEEVDELA